MIKRYLLVIALLSSSVYYTACATAQNAPNLTPVARNAYNLTQLVNAIGILQTTAENSVPNGVLKVNTARIIVQFCVTANSTILQIPNGWYATVHAAYDSAKSQLTQEELSKFGFYLATFEVVLNSFGS